MPTCDEVETLLAETGTHPTRYVDEVIEELFETQMRRIAYSMHRRVELWKNKLWSVAYYGTDSGWELF